MRKSRFTEEQIIKILTKHAAGMSALKEMLGKNFCHPACGDVL